MDEDDFETGDFIPGENEGDFKTPLGENEDAASDDDELGPQPKRFRSDSESTTASGMISYEYFIISCTLLVIHGLWDGLPIMGTLV